MSAPRTAFRTLFSRRAGTPHQIRTFARTSARRNAHESYTKSSKPPSSDLPWIVGSVGITVPAAFYLISSPSSGPHDVKHDAHAAKDSAKSAIETAKSTASEITHSSAPVSKAKDIASSAASSAKAATSSAVDSVKSHLPTTSTSSSTSAIDTAKDKAASAVESAKEKASEVAEDVKDYVVVDKAESKDPAKRDPGRSVKEPAGQGSMSQKQEGLANTDTKHVVFNTPRGDAIKKKSEGSHDSAKLKGTVDVNREPIGIAKKEKPAGAVEGEGEAEKGADQ